MNAKQTALSGNLSLWIIVYREILPYSNERIDLQFYLYFTVSEVVNSSLLSYLEENYESSDFNCFVFLKSAANICALNRIQRSDLYLFLFPIK